MTGMKKIFAAVLTMAAFLLLIQSCARTAGQSPEPEIQTGDLLFVGIPANYGDDPAAEAIASATSIGAEVNFIHTAILEVDSLGAVWVVDATIKHGVDRHPLDTLLSDFTLHRGGEATFEVMRLKDNRDAARFVEQAKSMAGEAYDVYFRASNGLHYCTELVYDIFVDASGNHIFETVPMNFKDKDGNMPSYWVRLFDRLGEEIPQGKPGTNPQMMHESPELVKVMSWTR